MTTEYIRYKIEPAQQQGFIDAITSASEILATVPDGLGYHLGHCQEDKDNFIWRIQWTSEDRHLNGFRKSEAFGPFFQLVKPYYNGIQEMNHYHTLIQSAQ